MRSLFIFSIILFFVGVYSVSAQDMIILRDGNVIEAKVLEISPSEIRYKRFDHLDGPTIVILANDVLSIRYENGRTEIISSTQTPEQQNIQVNRTKSNTMDPNKLNIGLNIEPSGFALYGPSLT